MTGPDSTRRRGGIAGWRLWGGGALAILLLALIVCEALGWPFLAGPVQRAATSALHRQVDFAEAPGAPPMLRINFLGGLRLRTPHLRVAAPEWSQAPHMVAATEVDLRLRYVDLWHAYRGRPLRIHSLKAARLDGALERLADGRASWEFGAKAPAPGAPSQPPPVVEELEVAAGTMSYRDALLQISLDTQFSLVDHSSGAAVPASSARAAASGASQAYGLVLTGRGTYRKNVELKIDVKTTGLLPLVAEDAATFALPVSLRMNAGGASLAFDGTATDAVHFGKLRGRFTVTGPSLAAIGDPLGITLPTTAAFRTGGTVAKEGNVYNAVFEEATIGASRLTGAFTYDAGRSKPLLSGRLSASKLLLADLAPTVGGKVRTGNVTAAAEAPRQPSHAAGKVLPDRPFDLPSLRAMDANVLVDVDNLDLGNSVLQPLRPLRTHLVLSDGVLTLSDIDARTAQGSLGGMIRLDGRGQTALWNTDLRWSNVRLEQWIHQSRGADAPPYISGRLNGQAILAGQGASTAAILGSLKGGVRIYLLGGKLSHLAVEAAGVDVAQAIGMLVKGDDALPIGCMVGDLVADRGAFKPRALVIDTTDSTVFVDGALSLATEALDLRIVVDPKDFSPLTLRTPILLRGTFADPKIGVEKKPLIERGGAALLLGLLNPFAAIIPLMDFGDSDDAKQAADRCRALAQRKSGDAPVAPTAAPKAARRVENRSAR